MATGFHQALNIKKNIHTTIKSSHMKRADTILGRIKQVEYSIQIKGAMGIKIVLPWHIILIFYLQKVQI